MKQSFILLIACILFIGALASYFADSYSQILMAASLSASILAGNQLYLVLRKPKALAVVSVFALILLIGGVIGLLYAASGGQPLLEVQVGYRSTELFLTTFSLARVEDFVRPSGIFDEPGAFVMFVAIVTIFNDVLQRNLRLNIVLVAMMLLTGSLAGLFLAILYVITSNGMRRHRKRVMNLVVALVLSLSVVLVAFPTNPISAAFDAFYSTRINIVDGRLAGDNRSNQIEDFFLLVDEEMLRAGTKSSAAEYITSDMSSNPFSITFDYGLIISLPYFVLLIWLLFVTFKIGIQNSYASLGLIFLLLQRPFIYNMSWSIMIVSAVVLLYYTSVRRGPDRILSQKM